MFPVIFSEYVKKNCKEEIEVISAFLWWDLSGNELEKHMPIIKAQCGDITVWACADFQFWQKLPYFQEINGIAAALAEELFHKGLLLYFIC